VLVGHTKAVKAVTPVVIAGRVLLASGSADRTVRLWDPVNEATVLSIPVYHPVFDCTQIADTLGVGLAAGIVVMSLNV
jgi:WD40 repeat protein